MDKYVRFVTSKKAYLVLGCLCNVEKHLPSNQFCRIHRSYIASFQHTAEFTNETVSIGDKELPIGKQYKTAFFLRAQILHADESGIAKAVSNEVDKLIEEL